MEILKDGKKENFIYFPTWNWPNGSKLMLLTSEKWRTVVLFYKLKKMQFIVKFKWIVKYIF